MTIYHHHLGLLSMIRVILQIARLRSIKGVADVQLLPRARLRGSFAQLKPQSDRPDVSLLEVFAEVSSGLPEPSSRGGADENLFSNHNRGVRSFRLAAFDVVSAAR